MPNKYILTEQQKMIDLYLNGCVNLYGFVTPRQFLKVYNRYNTPKLLKADLLRWAFKLERQTFNYTIYDNAIVSTRVPDQKIQQILQYQSDKKYYTPTQEEVLDYADADYYERTKELEELYIFLTKEMKVSAIIANSFVKQAEWHIRIEDPIHALLQLLSDSGIELNDLQQANKLFEKIQNANNNNRKWANCGYTPIEVYTGVYKNGSK